MDKEIIIDGVDVSGCDAYTHNHNELTPYGDVKVTEHYCWHINSNCDGKDCDCKQLQRAKAENKELNIGIEKCLENAGIECDDEEQALRTLSIIGSSLYKLQAENEQIKKDYAKLHIDFAKCNEENERLKAENKKLKYYLNKIREDELNSMDVEWDEYITECTSTEYTNVITFVELALGERDE